MMLPVFGKYAIYIWGVYTIAVIGLGGMFIFTWRKLRRLARQVRK